MIQSLPASCLAGLVAVAAAVLAVAFTTAGHGLVGLIFGLVALYAGRQAAGVKQSAPADPPPPAPVQLQQLPMRTDAQRQQEMDRHLAERETARAARRPAPPPQQRSDPNKPKVTWTHPDVWSGDPSGADLDPNEGVRTTTFAFDAPGGRPGPAEPTSSTRARARADGGSLRSWQQAEHSVRDWMQRNGYSDAQLTSRGADGGIDVTSGRAIAQVKHQLKPVGAAKIRELKGTASSSAHQRRSALFFATYGYSPQAIAAASDLGVQLYRYDGTTWRRAV